MTRVKRGKIKHKKRERLLKLTKGFRWGRKAKKRQAKEAVLHKLKHYFVGRKEKKRNFRRLWNVKIGAAAKETGIKYSKIISLFKKNNINLNRRVLSDLAQNHLEIFKKIIKFVGK